MVLNIDELLDQLQRLGLRKDEAAVYVELLKEPGNHLQLSRKTGVDRAKIYRLVEHLEKRGLIARRTDDRGTFLVASDPDLFEAELAGEEYRLSDRRNTLGTVLPTLHTIQTLTAAGEGDFSLKTYDGQAGFKQMCWHELKTKGEIITFGHGNIETLVNDLGWAAKHRTFQVAARYHTRDLVNPDKAIRSKLASERLYEARLYRAGVITPEVLRFDDQMVVYNNTVAIYHWQDAHKAGLEIISATFANTMRQLFEHYWKLTKEISFN